MKMHGLGNDYVLFDAVENELCGVDLAALARSVCKRRFSVGADGMIVVEPDRKDEGGRTKGERAPMSGSAFPGGPEGDFVMRVFNPDGSETGACGTAFRCVARWAYESKGFKDAATDGVRIATFARSVLAKVVQDASGKLFVEAKMGKALFKRSEIPAAGRPDDEFLEEPATIDGNKLNVSAVSVGNPHAVVFCDDVSRVEVERLGPAVERHPLFPDRTNVHFVQVIARKELRVRTWERGTGPTLSCGTGASAAVAIANRLGKVDTPVRVSMPGGILGIDIERDGEIIMQGEAEAVFSGWIDYEA